MREKMALFSDKLSLDDESMAYQLVGEVTAHQGDDG
jgi:lipopolysaccharide export system protein LptA